MAFQYQPLEEFGDMKYQSDLRIGFVRKVYGILSAQLLITTLFVIVGTLSQSFQRYIEDNAWVIILAIVGSFGSLITLVCFKNVAQKVPTNYILLGIFTCCEGLMVGCICGYYDPASVLMAAVMTLAVTVGLTVYAVTTKSDFTVMTGIMVVFLVAASMFGLFTAIFIHSRMTQVIVCSVFIIIYGIYLVIDTQLILGSGKYSFDEEDYIVAALNIYIDIVGLFIYILELVGNKR